MALFRGIQEYIALDADNITLVFDSGNIVNISGNIFLYPPQGHPILYNCFQADIQDIVTMTESFDLRMKHIDLSQIQIMFLIMIVVQQKNQFDLYDINILPFYLSLVI